VAWITDVTGQRAITGYAVDGTRPFSLPAAGATAVEAVEYDGDEARGREASRVHCGRWHVTAKGDGSLGIGSTPSFFALCGFEDWQARFAAFFALRPHAAFTRIEGVTGPFPVDRPSPIAPLPLTLADIDDIIAYVASVEPADLGAPVRHQ